jgi:hypothetical protein
VACIKKYKLVVRTCVRMKECRKRGDAMELTGSQNEEDLCRVALALFNDTVQVGNKELIYNIARTPGYNVGKNFEYQDQYMFLAKYTTVLEAGMSPGPLSHENSTTAAAHSTACRAHLVTRKWQIVSSTRQ